MKKGRIFNFAIAVTVLAVLVTGLIIGNTFVKEYRAVITAFLCGYGLDENSEATQAARNSGMKLAEIVAEEGMVVLRNENDILPLQNKKVNVFGVAGSNPGFIPQGTGSGTGSRNDLVTFLEGLTEANIEYNPTLAADYNALNYKHIDGGYVIEAYTDALYKQYYGVMEADQAFHNDGRMQQAASYSDTAIVVLGRILGEGNDYSKIQYIQNEANNTERKLQELSVREEYMLSQVNKYFDKVVVVFNTTNPMEAGFLEDAKYGIDGALFMGVPGTRGTIGAAKILSGEVNPSAKLTDTWAYDLASAASYATSAREGVGSFLDISTDTSFGTRANKYSEYIEDIYVGYKWYETADTMGYWDAAGRGGYDNVVQYPFGFGLSYTDFEWTIIPKTPENSSLAKDGKIEFELHVKNVGDIPGKDVIQLYYDLPYTLNGIEKSSVNLGAFAKTDLIEPGKVEIIDLALEVEDMKSYDCYDRNNNGFMGYELEAGTYNVSFRTSAHTLKTVSAPTKNTYSYRVTSPYRYEVDSVTGTKVENQFTNYTNTVSGATSRVNEPTAKNPHSVDGSDNDSPITYMTRSDFEGTFPKVTPANKNAGSIINNAHYVTVIPKTDPSDVAPQSGSKDTSWIIADMFGVPYEDPMWDEIVSQLTLAEKGRLIVDGGFGTIALPSIDKPRTQDADGPTGFNNSVIGQGNLKAVCYPSKTILAQTWDWYLGYQVGIAIGLEAKALGIQGWYGPGANLHRSPTGGRNFEYYSEDAYLSGIMCAYEILGAKEQGLLSYVKHIAVNDSESGRNGAYKFLTEQSLRELYLRPFEYITKIGKSNGMMTSVDRIGTTRASGSYAMLTQVLRNEWGFRGTVVTDYYQTIGKSRATDTIHDVDECVRAGNSQLLYPGGDLSWFDDSTSATALKEIHKSAKDILFAYADTLNYSETAQGLQKGSTITTPTDVFEWWIPTLVTLEVVIIAGLLTWGVFAALSLFWRSPVIRRKNKTKNEKSSE